MIQKENDKSLKISCGTDGWKVVVFRNESRRSHRFYSPTPASVKRVYKALKSFVVVNGRLMERNTNVYFRSDEMSITWYRHADGWY